MTNDQIIRNVRITLSECEAEARKQGYVGDSWTPTEADLEWVVMTLGGRKPTSDQWRAAGVAWVGGAHVGACDG